MERKKDYMLKIIIAIIIFSLIVLFHELGHFLLAKKNGICVEEFAIGIGPTIVGVKKGETKYSIKCLPFGGCCMMKGEDGNSDATDSFNSCSAKGRFWVIAAGPLFNFILAFVLALFMIGLGGADPAVIGGFSDNSPAKEAGLQVGDRILKMDNSRIYNFREISLFNFTHNDYPDIKVTYERKGEKKEIEVTRVDNGAGLYILGVNMDGYKKQSPLGVIKYSILEIRYQIKATVDSLKYLVSGKASVNDMSGPVGIVNMIGETYEASIPYGVLVVLINMLSFSILLSANLGVMNLLPIPALDGGRLLFIILEIIRGKKIDPEKEGMVHLAGMVLLLLLMVFIMANDIRNIFFT